MKALVIGGTGFVGSHIVDELLKRGYDVCVLKRTTSRLDNLCGKNISFIDADLNDPCSLRGKLDDFDYVFHSAGVIKARSKREFFKHNRDLTVNIISVLKSEAKGLNRFVYIGTLSSLGSSNESLIKEDKPACPITAYGMSKLEATKAVIDSGLPYTIFFPPAVYGPRDLSFLIYFRVMKKGVAPVVGSRHNRFSVVYVGNLVEAVVDAVECEKAKNESFFVADYGVQSWESFITLAAKIMGVKVRLVTVPKSLAFLVGRLLEFKGFITGKPSFITYEKVKELSLEWICSTEKIKEKMGYSPKITTEAGLTLTIDWYRKNGYL